MSFALLEVGRLLPDFGLFADVHLVDKRLDFFVFSAPLIYNLRGFEITLVVNFAILSFLGKFIQAEVGNPRRVKTTSFHVVGRASFL